MYSSGIHRLNRLTRLAPLLIFSLLVSASPALRAQAIPHGTVEKISVHGPSLEGNLEGDPADRDVYVYLPPSYASNPTHRYPVLYLLHGFTDRAALWFGKEYGGEHTHNDIPAIMDRDLANHTGKEMIVVMPDAFTRFAGSFYSNSVTTGNWEDFISRDLVSAIDAKYRTLATRDSRGLAGHSMGGYGTVRIAMKHPDVFSSFYALSPATLLWGADLSPNNKAQITKAYAIKNDEQLAKADFSAHGAFSLAAAWSPNPKNPPFYFDLPATRALVPRQDIIAKWSANMPLAMLDQYRTNLQSLHAIAFDVGTRDEFLHIRSGARALDAALTRYNIPHTFEIYDGTHSDHIPQRVEFKVIPFFANNLKF